MVQLPVYAEAAAAGVSLQRAHTALAHRPPPPLFRASGAPHAQGTLVAGHTIWYSVPKKQTNTYTVSDQTNRNPSTVD